MTKHGQITSLRKQLDEMAFERNNAAMNLARLRDSRGMWRALAVIQLVVYSGFLVAAFNGS